MMPIDRIFYNIFFYNKSKKQITGKPITLKLFKYYLFEIDVIF